jgi:hypothetical protein
VVERSATLLTGTLLCRIETIDFARSPDPVPLSGWQFMDRSRTWLVASIHQIRGIFCKRLILRFFLLPAIRFEPAGAGQDLATAEARAA